MEKHIGFQVKMLSKLIKKRVDADLGGEGLELTGMQRWLIHYLYTHPGEELFQRDIEKRFGIGRSSATELLKSLEEAGMITRTPVSRDARLKRIALTTSAALQQKRIERALTEIEDELVKDLSEAEEKQLRDLLDRCIASMSDEDAESATINTDTKNFANKEGE